MHTALRFLSFASILLWCSVAVHSESLPRDEVYATAARALAEAPGYHGSGTSEPSGLLARWLSELVPDRYAYEFCVRPREELYVSRSPGFCLGAEGRRVGDTSYTLFSRSEDWVATPMPWAPWPALGTLAQTHEVPRRIGRTDVAGVPVTHYRGSFKTEATLADRREKARALGGSVSLTSQWARRIAGWRTEVTRVTITPTAPSTSPTAPMASQFMRTALRRAFL